MPSTEMFAERSDCMMASCDSIDYDALSVLAYLGFW